MEIESKQKLKSVKPFCFESRYQQTKIIKNHPRIFFHFVSWIWLFLLFIFGNASCNIVYHSVSQYVCPPVIHEFVHVICFQKIIFLCGFFVGGKWTKMNINNAEFKFFEILCVKFIYIYINAVIREREKAVDVWNIYYHVLRCICFLGLWIWTIGHACWFLGDRHPHSHMKRMQEIMNGKW